ncbi:hypothetical protein L2E82_47132 [Cichorium intybus]|uniref:Uncharacterized protein n=1 Tax=Cichorium intybus TaxID=13427 RepID=A0ACB8YTY0_CICIN|nr:hypothetical protein L2E82_47132 [Cichorium intybus]
MDDKTMSEKTGGTISEEDVSVFTQRYTATTVITLLQEVGQVQDVKIDWNAMVKHTKTGITNPREYQMLWRHLAYREPLIGKLEDDVKPLDDDSDLEYELEAVPTVSNEASAEAAAYVKVLNATESLNDSCIEKGLFMEAPLMINIPKDKSTPPPSDDTQPGSSMSGVNITVPVFVPTQVVPTVLTAESLDTTNTCANSNFPPRRKRKPWSADEDRELFAAVQRCGEGNWANMSKGDFKGDRTASQLSQRWNIIKRRQTTSNVKTSSQLSEAQLAARRALNMALDKPGIDGIKAASSLGGTNFGNKPVQPTIPEPPPAATLQQNKFQPDPKRQFPRSQPFPKQLPTGPDAVKAAAVAAGARIATQSAAAVILKAQLKTAIHIKTVANVTGRPPVAPIVRYSSISPNGPRSNLHLAHASPNVGPTVQVNQPTGPNGGHEVKDDHVAVSENLQKMKLESGLKDEQQEEKLAGFGNQTSMNIES